MIACLYRRNQAQKLKSGEYKYLEWTSNGTLQLQRLAYQGIKSGTWSGYADDIPMTEAGALLGDLTNSYPEVDQAKKAGPESTAEKRNHAATVQAVPAPSSDGCSETGTGSVDSGGPTSTPAPETGVIIPVPGQQSTARYRDSGGGGEGVHHQTASLTCTTGSIRLGSGTDTVSPVSPFPTDFEPPTLVTRHATLGANNTVSHQGGS